MTTKKNLREAQYRAAGMSFGTLSRDLIVSACRLLGAALADRRTNVVRLAKNHYSECAVGSIVLTTIAIEASVNEIAQMAETHGATQTKLLALKPTCQKFRLLSNGAHGSDAIEAELRLLVDVRDEIVHFLPRQVCDVGNVPEWFRELHQRGLFIEAPHGDFQFAQKLPSYALAYWAWEVGAAALDLVVGALPAEPREICGLFARNFKMYRAVCLPAELAEFDAEYRLEVTRFVAIPPIENRG